MCASYHKIYNSSNSEYCLLYIKMGNTVTCIGNIISGKEIYEKQINLEKDSSLSSDQIAINSAIKIQKAFRFYKNYLEKLNNDPYQEFLILAKIYNSSVVCLKVF